MTKRNKILAAASLLAAAAVAVFAAWGPITRLWRQVFRLPDENGMYQVGEHWFEVMPELDEESIARFAGKLDSIQSNILTPQNRCFYAVIPDKSWYVREEGYQTLDQQKLLDTLRQNLTGSFTEIELSSALSVDNYYRSDRHWRQETLQPVLDALGDAMGFAVNLNDFTANQFEPFRGSYAKYLPENWDGEPISYLTSPDTEAAIVENPEHPEVTGVYDLERLETDNSYDLYLSGVSPLVTIRNPNLQNGRELVIFRDSFTSSLAPLLLGEYETITLVDLRFLFSSKLPEFVEFTDQDVLFLYSTWIVNNSAMLR